MRADVMPMRETEMHPTNVWYEPAMQFPLVVDLQDVEGVRIVSAPYFLATKLVAFESRGHDDYYGSHDLEDVMAVIIGREELEGEIATSPSDVREFLAGRVRRLLASPQFVEALEGFLSTVSSPVSAARLHALTVRLERIATG
ncbi:MAG: hypothetical protein IPK07_27965 [Deltaproteobacteria bacterium]|nr:hypothetical protein [Deltaproteobacteria bacterium]